MSAGNWIEAMKKLLVVVLILTAAVAGVAGAEAPLGPFESDVDPTPRGRIDELVFDSQVCQVTRHFHIPYCFPPKM